MSHSEKEEKAHNAITYIIARYLRVKDFAITESFTGYLFLRIKHELFYQRKVEKIVDFVDVDTFRRCKMRFDEKGNPILTLEEQKKLFDAEKKKDIGRLLLEILNELKGLREDLKKGKTGSREKPIID